MPNVDSANNGVIKGMAITNNCVCQINPLKNILGMFSSSKGKSAEYIGENGVSLKRGCASISDLSVVFMKNKQELSLGVIAKPLKQPEGCAKTYRGGSGRGHYLPFA
eukprot:7326698-Ditylum_brightwellii.AAC.1